MKLVDIALILQIFFFLVKNYINLNSWFEIWVNVILPFLILYERYRQNKDIRKNAADNQKNVEISSSKKIPETIFDERNNLKNNSSNSSA